MARYKKTYRKRRYYRRKKWTPYNSEVTVNAPGQTLTNGYALENAASCIYGASNSLGQYAAADTALSAVNYYVCRPRFKGVLSGPLPANVNYILYLCYIPNAVNVDTGTQPIAEANLRSAYFYLHPEYVLAWTRLDYINNTGDTGEVSLYTKIKKRISPGDRLAFVVLARNNSNAAQSLVNVQGTFSCYLRTN